MAEFAAESGQLRRVFKMHMLINSNNMSGLTFQEHNNNSAGVSDLQRRVSRQSLEVNTAKVVTHTVRENSHKVENNVFCSLGL